MVYYRVIKRSYSPLNGSVEWSIHTTLLEAYKKCIPKNEESSCRRLYTSVVEEFKTQQILHVTHTFIEEGEITDEPSSIYWIERVDTINDSMPLNPPMPTCIHG